MTRAKKAKRYPPSHRKGWILHEAIHLLEHLGAGKTLNSYPWEPGSPDEEPPIDAVIMALKQIEGGADARVALGQTPGRGGNTKSKTSSFEVALEYERGRRAGFTVADACTAVRTKFNIEIRDNTIIKKARTQRAAVRERLAAHLEFKDD